MVFNSLDFFQTQKTDVGDQLVPLVQFWVQPPHQIAAINTDKKIKFYGM